MNLSLQTTEVLSPDMAKLIAGLNLMAIIVVVTAFMKCTINAIQTDPDQSVSRQRTSPNGIAASVSVLFLGRCAAE